MKKQSARLLRKTVRVCHKSVDYLDRFSFNVTKKTVIVLDNASVHRNRKVKELRKIW